MRGGNKPESGIGKEDEIKRSGANAK